MSNVDKEILKFIKRVNGRIHRNTVIETLVWGLILSLFAGCITGFVSLLRPIVNLYMLTGKIMSVIIIISIFVGLLRVPKKKKAALTLDSLGLRERAITAYELIGNESSFAMLQKKDAVDNFRSFNYKKKLVPKILKKQVILLLASAGILVTTGFIPSRAKDIASKIERFNNAKKSSIEKVEKLRKTVEDNKTLSEEDKRSLEEALTEIREQIAEASDTRELSKALEKIDMNVNLVKEKYNDKDLKDISNSMSNNPATQGISQAIDSGDKEALKEAVNKLPENLKNASEEEKKNTLQDLSKLAEQMRDDSMKESLKEVSRQLAQQQNNQPVSEELKNSLDKFSGSLGSMMDKKETNKSLSDFQDNIKPDIIQQSGQQLEQPGKQGETQGQTGQGSEGTKGQQEGQNTQQNSQQGASGQQGSNSSGSQGQNPGKSGNSGSQTGQGEQGGLNRPGSSGSNTGENVYAPGINSSGETSNISGNPSSQGSSEVIKDGTANASRGENVPLEQAIGYYKEKAYENMHEAVIPDVMKDIIKSYFASLEQ